MTMSFSANDETHADLGELLKKNTENPYDASVHLELALLYADMKDIVNPL